ncbi:hypothetical protein ABC766_08565 [Methylobacterium fujisawaense]|jgi:hypothetical protein|uniref:hypothetical protein n=1 Tax=Methylobacterium fujisawaense TaxID=107400 RepID=UPI0031F542D3
MRANDDPHPLDRPRMRRNASRECHPLALWRTVRLPDIGAEAINRVRRALAGDVCLHHRSWPAARRGDAAAAIAVTLDLARGRAPDPAVTDLALSAVLLAAWGGDAAARVVLGHVRAGPRPRRQVAGPRSRVGVRAPGRRPAPRR